MRIPQCLGHLPAALLLLLATLPLAAQELQSEFVRELEFARGLATKWGYTDMAESVLARLEAAGVGGRQAAEIQRLRCDMHAIEAARAPGRESRESALKAALGAYENYLAGERSAEDRAEAESAYLDAAQRLGRSLCAAIEDAGAAPSVAIRKELLATLTRPVSLTGKLVNEFKGPAGRTQNETRQLCDLLLTRGALLLSIARSETEASAILEQARQAFEMVVDLAGESSSAGLRAFVGVGEVFLARGKSKEAADCFRFVGEVAIPHDPSQWLAESKDLGADEIRRRFALLQLATPGLLRAETAGGNHATACSEGLRLINLWQRDGLELVRPHGYECLLAIASLLNQAGGFVGGEMQQGDFEWFAGRPELQAKFSRPAAQRTALDLALALAQQVCDQNRGNPLGSEAARLITKLIDQPGVDVPPAILIAAARGKADEQDLVGAIEIYQRVLHSIEDKDQAQRKEYGGKVLYAIGSAYMSLDMPREAALAFQQAVTHWRGQPEYDALNSRGFYNAAAALRRRLPDDVSIESMLAQAEQAVLDNDQEAGGEFAFRLASKIFEGGQDYAKAREIYRCVSKASESYEKAWVFVGVCEFQLGKAKRDYDAAILVFDGYLNGYLKDPLHSLGAEETTRQARRSEASASAVYYWGYAEFDRADAGLGKWERVVEILSDFEARFPTQQGLLPATVYRVSVAQRQLGRPAEAEAGCARLLAQFPTNPWTARAALDGFNALEATCKRLRESKDPADRPRLAEALRKQAGYLEVVNQNTANPSFVNLRRESKLWMELEAWDKAEVTLTKIRAKFASGDSAAEVSRYVLPDLGTALVKQDKLKQCAEVLAPLVENNQATFATTLDYAHALAGYAELSSGEDRAARSMRVVTGVGGAEAWTKAAQLYGKLLETVRTKESAWSRTWLLLKFDLIYCLCQHATIDSRLTEAARTQLKVLQGEYGGDDMPGLQEPDLTPMFTWLIQQVK